MNDCIHKGVDGRCLNDAEGRVGGDCFRYRKQREACTGFHTAASLQPKEHPVVPPDVAGEPEGDGKSRHKDCAGQRSVVDPLCHVDPKEGYPPEARHDCEPDLQVMALAVANGPRGEEHPVCYLECRSYASGRCARPCSVGAYGEDMRRALAGQTSRIITSVPHVPGPDAP